MEDVPGPLSTGGSVVGRWIDSEGSVNAATQTFMPLLAFVLSCTTGPSVRMVGTGPKPRERPEDFQDRAVEGAPLPNLSIRLAFDTGPSWWTDPDKECPQWSAALPIARRMAGCASDYVGDPTHPCQAIIRKCSPGCDVCRNLKPGEGPDSDFGSVIQPPYGETFATTRGPGLFGGHDTRFDRTHVCHDATLLAKVMVHEAAHACRGAGGSKTLYDEKYILKIGTPGCYADLIAPFEGNRQCGDPL